MLYILSFLFIHSLHAQSTMQDVIYDQIDKKPTADIYDNQIGEQKAKIRKDGTISGGNIYFELNRHTILPTEHIKIEELAGAILKLEDRVEKVIIEGFASKDGDPNHNFDLGNNRAKAVKEALILEGISDKKIEVYTYGEGSMFQFSNINKNRRTQIKVKLKN